MNWSQIHKMKLKKISLKWFAIPYTFRKNTVHVVGSDTKNLPIPISIAIESASFDVFVLFLFVIQPQDKKISFTMGKNWKIPTSFKKVFGVRSFLFFLLYLQILQPKLFKHVGYNSGNDAVWPIFIHNHAHRIHRTFHM